RDANRLPAITSGSSKRAAETLVSVATLISTSPDRLHDLHVVALDQAVLGPDARRHHLPVHRDGDAPRALNAARGEQLGEGCGRERVGFSVEANAQHRSVSARMGR